MMSSSVEAREPNLLLAGKRTTLSVPTSFNKVVDFSKRRD